MLFKTPPPDFKKQADIVACYLVCDGKIPLLHRLPHKREGGLWGLPAGRAEVGESLTMPLVRDQDECVRLFFKL